MMTRLATTETELLHWSVAVNVYGVIDVEPQPGSGVPAEELTTTVPQPSTNMPPPLVVTAHSMISAVLSTPHSTIRSAGAFMTSGFSSSITV